MGKLSFPADIMSLVNLDLQMSDSNVRFLSLFLPLHLLLFRSLPVCVCMCVSVCVYSRFITNYEAFTQHSIS